MPDIQINVFHSGWLFAFVAVVWLFFCGCQAQVIDTTRQKPQLETSPPAGTGSSHQPGQLPDRQKQLPLNQNPVEEKNLNRQEPTLLQKLFIGGSGDLGFSSNSYYGNFFNIGASPILGYRITKSFAVGPGLVY